MIHCENGMCGICDECVEDDREMGALPPCPNPGHCLSCATPERPSTPVPGTSHPLTADQRVAVLERALAESEASRQRYADTIAWQAKQLDEALARAGRAEEQWRASQRQAEELGRRIAMRPVGVP